MSRRLLYNGAVEIDFNQVKHAYTNVKTGETIPSVTSILKVVAKDVLVNWAAKMASNYCYDQIMNNIGCLDEIKVKQICDDAKWAHKRAASTAADIGTLAHGYIEQHITSILYGTDQPKLPINEQAVNAVDAFLSHERKLIKNYIYSERIVYSQHHKYVGTADIVAELNTGELAMVDIKTSSGIYHEYYAQCAAYVMALEEEFTDMRFDKIIIMRIGKDGSFECKSIDRKEFINASVMFLSAHSLHKSLDKIKKLVIKEL